jgi:hypothetical protein
MLASAPLDGLADIKLQRKLQPPTMLCGESTRSIVVMGIVSALHVSQPYPVIECRWLAVEVLQGQAQTDELAHDVSQMEASPRWASA